LKNVIKPDLASDRTIIATSGDKSIIPSGGMNFLKISRYGSQIFARITPKEDSRAPGNQDIKI